MAASPGEQLLQIIIDQPESAFTPAQSLSKQITASQATDSENENTLRYTLILYSKHLSCYKDWVWTIVSSIQERLGRKPDAAARDRMQNRKKNLEDKTRGIQVEQDRISNEHSETLAASAGNMRESIVVLTEQRWVIDKAKLDSVEGLLYCEEEFQ